MRGTEKNSEKRFKFSLINQGCRLNAAESQRLISSLQKKGWKLASPEEAGVILINTCTVTHRADADLRKLIRRLRRQNPQARIIALGCYVDHYGKAEGADLSLPNPQKMRVLELLRNGEFKGKRKRWKSRGFLKVQEGCDLACTYCIIPKVRGRSRSVPLGKIREELEELLKEEYQEVILTGIHLESYGRDLGEKQGLLKLLRSLEIYYPEIRFRISSLDPRFLNPELLSYLLSSPHIMPSFHLSLQHRSAKILRLMGRGSGEGFEELIFRIKNERPEAGVGADFIVGFPGETEEDFSILYRFAREVPLTYFHVFSFSPRKGTRAAEMRAKIPERISKKRAALLRGLGRRKTEEFARSMVGKTLEATVIKEGEALSENYLRVKFDEKLPPGRRFIFKIIGFLSPYLRGISQG